MSNKRRPRRSTVTSSLEGLQEVLLLMYLKEIYVNQQEVSFRENPIDYYRKNLSREILEERRKEIPELDLLVKMISTD